MRGGARNVVNPTNNAPIRLRMSLKLGIVSATNNTENTIIERSRHLFQLKSESKNIWDLTFIIGGGDRVEIGRVYEKFQGQEGGSTKNLESKRGGLEKNMMRCQGGYEIELEIEVKSFSLRLWRMFLNHNYRKLVTWLTVTNFPVTKCDY